MADDSWLDDPSLYQRKPGKAKASDDAWLDDPSLYEAKSGPWSDVTGGSWAAVGAGGQPKSYVGRVKESISREVADARNVLGSMGEVLGPSGAGTLAKVFAAGEDMTAGAYRAVADTSLARAIGVDGLYNAAADRAEREFQLNAEAARLADADAQAIQGRFRDGSLGYHAVGAAQSIPQMAGAVGVSVLGTPLAGAGFMGATTGLGQYADARADGADRGTAALSGAIHGVAEGGMDYVTLGLAKYGARPVLGKVASALGESPIARTAAVLGDSAPGRLAFAAGAEVPSELATTEAQMRSDEMLGLRQYTPEEWARARRDTIIQSAGMGAGMYAITAPLGSRAEGRPAQVEPADEPFMGRVTTDPETGLPSVDLVPNDAPDVAVAPEPTADIDALLGQVPPEVLGEVAKAVAPVLDTKALADAGVILGEPAPTQADTAPSDASSPEPAFNEVEAWLRGLQEVMAKPEAAPVPASAAPAPATDAVPEMAPQAVESEPVAAELPITSGEQPSTEPQQRPSRFSALDMKSLVGWSTMGGRLVRAAPDESTFNDEERQGIVDTPKGEVIGRTSWVGMAGPDGQESTFWRNRPVKFTPAKANAAFDKYERGEKLSKPEQRFIDYAQQVAEQYDQAMQLLDDEKAGYEQEARMWEREELRASAGVAIDEADGGEALSLYELYREIARAGGNLDEAQPAPNEGGGEYAARLWNKLNEARNGADQRAETGDRTQGVRGRSGRNPEPVQQEQAAGFRLDQEQDGTARAAAQEVTPSPGGFALEGQQKSQAVEDDEARRAVSARQTGLFGASETRRAADEQRESRERNAPDAGGGGGLFAGRGSDPSPEARQRQAAAERSQLQGERDADELGLREAVDEVLQGADVTVRYLADDYGLDGLVHEGYADRLRSQQQKRGYVGRTAGVYIPAHWSMDGKPFVVLFTGVVRDPISAQFTVAHEVAGHHGLRTLLGNDLDNVLRLADQNPTVKAVADSMMRRRKLGADKRLLAVEEALSDINAALRTGDFHELKRRHGIDIPEGIRASLERAIDNIVRKLRELFNKQGITFSDEQVRSLLDAAWSAAKRGNEAISEPESVLESVEDQTQARSQFAGMTREQFLGKPKITSNANAADLVPRARAELSDVEAVPFAAGEGLTAKYSPHSSAVFDGDKVVASYNDGSTLVVDKKYRRQGIAEELVYQWRSRNPSAKPATTRTKASQALQEKVWKRIERERATELNQSAPIYQTQTEAFKRWFGDSKVVDENGRPLVVYHGTNADFSAFDPSAQGSSGQGSGEPGFFFEASPDNAGRYTRQGGGGNVMPVYLSLKNPLIVERTNAKYDYDGSYNRVAFANFIDDALEAGHDGVIFRDVLDRGKRSTQYVAFRPEQIKSATGNRGTFDPANPSILESVDDDGRSGIRPDSTASSIISEARAEARRDEAASTLNVQRGAIGWNLETGQYEGVRKHLRQLRLNLQDKMKSWQDVQADIESQTGTLIEDAANVYRIENLMHGRVSTGIENIERRQVKPLLDAMKAANVSAAELEGYLYARHAKERNAQIASINPNMQDGGSGMTNAEADAALAAVDRGRLEPLARMVDAITKATRQRMLEHGLITAEQHAAMEAQYKHYVPLRGKEARDGGFEVDLKNAGNLGGRGVDGRGKVLRQALGRGAGNRATNILGEIIGDAQRSIILAEKARVGRAAMRLVLQHPNPNLWTLEPVQTERALNAAGEVYERVLNDMSDPSIIAVRHKGKLYRVQVHNADLARALNLVGVDQMVSILRAAGSINRYFSAVLTKYNPAFVGANMTRDAVFGLTGLAVEHGERVAAKAAANYPAAARAGWRLSRGTLGSGRMDKYAREFADAGGRTGYVAMPSVEDLERQVNNVNLTSSTAQARRALTAVGDFIGSANDAIENALRLSAYATLREEGASVDKAAEYAKNLTVNFNRKGHYGSHVGAAILFFNASMQGVHRLSKLMARPKTYAYLGTLASAQAVAAMFAMGIEDDDDEPIWNKVPDHVKRRNIVIITPDKDIITIPMPYGFNVFTYLGGQAVGYVMNDRRGDTSISGTAGDLAGRTVLAAVESFSPIPLDRGVKTLVPTQAGGILYDIAMNENGFGGQIRRENPWDDRPLSVVGKPDTMEVFKLAAKGLNRVGGGDDYTKPKFGFFDRAPEDIEYLADQLAGGAGKFVVDVATLGSKSMDAGADVTAKDFPVTNRFVSNIDEAAAQRSLFFERKEAVDQSKRRIRAAFGAGTPEEVAKAEAMMRDLPGMAGARFKRRKKASKSGPAGGVVTVSGSPQFEAVPGTAFAAIKAADKAYDARNEVVETAYAQAPAWGPIKGAAGRERDAKIRAADAELTKSLKALTEAWNREAAAKLH